MKYIIMASTLFHLGRWPQPKQLSVINGEILIERTIRLLREHGVDDISITTNRVDLYDKFGVDVIEYDSSGAWLNAFYPTEEPVCYIFGDVYFSDDAIKTIVEEEVSDIQFFASAPPFTYDYSKKWAEPFAFKVVDQVGFHDAISVAKDLMDEGKFKRHPIAWELWQVIKGTELNKIDYTNYRIINDYTCDLDYPDDVQRLEEKLKNVENKSMLRYVIHTYPTRKWYVDKYLIPSMLKQGCEDITIYVDEKKEGSLKAHLDSFLSLPYDDGGTWHIQDDVIICKDFYHRTKIYNGGIVCGFSSEMYDGDKMAGLVNREGHWFSFPCIRIPNRIAIDFAKWVNEFIIGNPVYKKFWIDGKNEDWAFWSYIKDQYRHMKILNLAPNLVDHIDYLIGGSASAKSRENPCRSQYWEDEDLVEALAKELES